MKKRMKGFLIGTAIAAGVAAIGTFYHATAKTLLKIALDLPYYAFANRGTSEMVVWFNRGF